MYCTVCTTTVYFSVILCIVLTLTHILKTKYIHKGTITCYFLHQVFFFSQLRLGLGNLVFGFFSNFLKLQIHGYIRNFDPLTWSFSGEGAETLLLITQSCKLFTAQTQYLPCRLWKFHMQIVYCAESSVPCNLQQITKPPVPDLRQLRIMTSLIIVIGEYLSVAKSSSEELLSSLLPIKGTTRQESTMHVEHCPLGKLKGF